MKTVTMFVTKWQSATYAPSGERKFALFRRSPDYSPEFEGKMGKNEEPYKQKVPLRYRRGTF